MDKKVLVFYGSYREPRYGIRFANYVTSRLLARGIEAELIDARQVGLPMLSRMYKEYPRGTAPGAMETLANKIRSAHGFVFVCGEYNWGIQSGLKSLTDHFFEEWFWRPAAVVSYSFRRVGGARAGYRWHGILNEMGMIVISSSISVGPIAEALDEEGHPIGQSGDIWTRHFQGLRMTWFGGRKRPLRNGNVAHPRTSGHVALITPSRPVARYRVGGGNQ